MAKNDTSMVRSVLCECRTTTKSISIENPDERPLRGRRRADEVTEKTPE